MSKYYYAQSHFDYGVMVTPSIYLKNPIWVIRAEKSKSLAVIDGTQIPVEKDIERVLDMRVSGKLNNLTDCYFKANTLEELKAKLRRQMVGCDFFCESPPE